MKRFVSILSIFLSVGFPFFVYWGLNYLQPRVITLVVGVVITVRMLLTFKIKNISYLIVKIPFIFVVVLAFAFLIQFNQKQYLFFVPVLINLGLLIIFAQTLWKSPTMIEVFARMQADDLDAEEIDYCRTVTKIWISFFIINGTLALIFAVFGSLAQWTIYNGFLAYIAIGCLFSIEWLYRHWRFDRFKGTRPERIIRQIITIVFKK